MNNSIYSSSENMLQEHHEDVDPEMAMILSILGLTTACVLLTAFIALQISNCSSSRSGFSKHLDPERNFLFQPRPVIGFSVALFLLLVTCILAVVYSNRLLERDQQDYQGKMRIVDVRYQERLKEWTETTSQNCNTASSSSSSSSSSYSSSSSSSSSSFSSSSSSSSSSSTTCTRKTTKHYELYYDAIFTLDWGYGWACGSVDNMQCQASELTKFKRRICGRKSCSDGEHERAMDYIQNRVSSLYDNSKSSYTPYDPWQGPSTDVNWPSLVAYGDCHTCQVRDSVTGRTSLKRLRYATWGFLGAWGFVSVCLLVAWMIRRWKPKSGPVKVTCPVDTNSQVQSMGIQKPNDCVTEEVIIVEATPMDV